MRMTAMRLALEELALTKSAAIVNEEPTDGIWFRHMTPLELTKLEPLNYKELQEARPGYNMKWRRDTEDQYHQIFEGAMASPDCTFLYATICGFHRMDPPEKYDGYTYYFRLSEEQIENTLFEVVDAEHRMKATRGKEGLEAAIKHWEENKDKFSSYHEENLGDVHPRIEVIIPFAVFPHLVYPNKAGR